MATETDPALPNLESLPPNLRHDTEHLLHGLTHTDLFTAEDDIWSEELERPAIPETAYTPDQHDARDFAQAQMERAAGYILAAHQELTETGQGISTGRVLTQAADLAVEASQAAHEAGQREASVEALETFLVLRTFDGRSRTEDPEAILNIVRTGLASELVEAARETHGLTYIERDERGRVEERWVGAQPWEHSELLQLAADEYFDFNFQEVTPFEDTDPEAAKEYRSKLAGELPAIEMITLAESKAGQEPTEAATLAVAAVEKLATGYSLGLLERKAHLGVEVARLIGQAAELCAQADAQTQTAQYHEAFQDAMTHVRQRRRPGDSYRLNDAMTYRLDQALVVLVQEQQIDLARQLVSSSPKELEVYEESLQDAEEVFGIDEAGEQEILKVLEGLHHERRAALTQELQADTAIDDVAIEEVIELAHDPDVLLDMPRETLRRLMEPGQPVLDVSLLGNEKLMSILSDPRTVISAEVLGDAQSRSAILEAVRYGSLDQGINQVNQSVQMYQELMTADADTAQKNVLYTLLRYDDPQKLWNLTQELFGDKVLEKTPQFLNIISYHTALEAVSAKLTELQRRVETFCDVTDLLDSTEPISLEKYDGVDFDALRAAFEKVQSGDEVTSIHLRQMITAQFQQIQDPSVLIDMINQAPPEFMELLRTHAKDRWLAARLLEGTMYASPLRKEPRTAEQQLIQTAQYAAIFEQGLGELYQNDEMTVGQRRDLVKMLLFRPDAQELVSQIERSKSIFGPVVGLTNLELLQQLVVDGTVPESFRALGVTKVGESGVDQLKARLQQFEQRVFETGQVPVGLLMHNEVLLQHFKRLVRFEESQFGDQSDGEFLKLLTTAQKVDASMDATYQVGDYRIESLDREAVANFQVSEDGVREWQSYVAVINRAMEIVPAQGQLDWEKFGKLLQDIQLAVEAREEQMSGGIGTLRARIEDMRAKDKDTAKLEEQLTKQTAAQTALQNIRYDAVHDFDIKKLCEQITELAGHKSIATMSPDNPAAGLVQTLLVTSALIKLEQDGQPRPDFSTPDATPSIEDIAHMGDFIGHITNQETWGELFDAVGGRKQLNTLLSINALEENIARKESIATAGSQIFRFVPSRGALMELSGHIGDACWASKYESIAEEFPNLTSVIMVQNADNANRRLSGSALLIETTSSAGEPLLVIRGLNPIQNTINQLSEKSFLAQFATYAQSIATAQGRKLAIVIDDHSGGSATNRPTLFSLLEQIKPRLAQVPLASELDTKFNGYNIVDETYLLTEADIKSLFKKKSESADQAAA